VRGHHPREDYGTAPADPAHRKDPMANLCFQRIQPVAQNVGDDNGAVPDVYFNPFNLSGLVDKPALLLMQVRNVEFDHNFVSINHMDQVDRQALNGLTTGNAAAVLDDNFVDRILPSGDNQDWTLAIFRVKSVLRPTGNVLGIHSRNASGGTSGNRDDFRVDRIFLIYSGSD
jgi:hypothetical protein